jgi:hypothetical protein
MATSTGKNNESSAHSRIGEWKEILDIVKDFDRLNVSGTRIALTVDDTVKPLLRTSEQCIRALTKRMDPPWPSSLVEFLQSRVDQLRQRTLLSYTESVSQMASLSAFTGRNDSDVQREHSRSVEIWFDHAIEELFAALVKQYDVRVTIRLYSNPSMVRLISFTKLRMHDTEWMFGLPIPIFCSRHLTSTALQTTRKGRC